MRDDRHSTPFGPLLLVLLLVLATLTLGWWAPSAARALVDYQHAGARRTVAAQEVDAAVAAMPDTARVLPGLVNIDTVTDSAQGSGTGMVLTPAGQVLTNNHVIEGARSISAVDVGNGRRYAADVVGYDRLHDVAVIALRGASTLAVAPIGRSAGLAVGDPVTAVGNAGGRGGSPAQAPGRVIGLDQRVDAADESGGSESLQGLIAAQADVQPGDSGGAMVGRDGAVVGMTTAAARSQRVRAAGGAGFAIPIDQARGIAAQITGGGSGPSIHRGPTAVLGVIIAETAGDDAAAGASPGSLSVQDVDPASSAGVAGLLPGDTITTFDGHPTGSRSALRDGLATHRPGDRVVLGWTDALGSPHRGPVRLVEGPPA